MAPTYKSFSRRQLLIQFSSPLGGDLGLETMSGFGFSLDGIKSKLAEAGEKVKARVNEIDAGRMRETLAKAGATAQESISHVSTLGAAQLHETTQQARQLADRQAKQLSKVNAKALLNSNAHFGVPLEALAFSSADAEATEVASVPLVLEMMLAYFESTPRITSVSQLFSVTANASVGVTALAKVPCTPRVHPFTRICRPTVLKHLCAGNGHRHQDSEALAADGSGGRRSAAADVGG